MIDQHDKAMIWTVGMLEALIRLGVLTAPNARQAFDIPDKMLFRFIALPRSYSPTRQEIVESLVALQPEMEPDQTVVDELLRYGQFLLEDEELRGWRRKKK
jgi:hypothetical protein